MRCIGVAGGRWTKEFNGGNSPASTGDFRDILALFQISRANVTDVVVTWWPVGAAIRGEFPVSRMRSLISPDLLEAANLPAYTRNPLTGGLREPVIVSTRKRIEM